MLSKRCSAQHVRGQKFESLATGRPHILTDMVFDRCEFSSVLLGDSTGLLGRRHRFENVQAIDCGISNCLIKNADLTQTQFLRCVATAGGIVLWKCVLREVTFDGSYEVLRVLPTSGSYEAVDETFAIDIRNATFGEIEILGIPPQMVKYDSATGGALSRAALEDAGWPFRQVSDFFGGIMVKFRTYGGDSSIYIVPTKDPDSSMLLRELDQLRARGWIE